MDKENILRASKYFSENRKIVFDLENSVVHRLIIPKDIEDTPEIWNGSHWRFFRDRIGVIE